MASRPVATLPAITADRMWEIERAMVVGDVFARSTIIPLAGSLLISDGAARVVR